MDVTFLYHADCGHCRKALDTVRDELADVPDAVLRPVDVEDHPEVADRFDLRSCPGIAVDGHLEFVGVPTQQELLDCLDSLAPREDDPQWRRRNEGGPSQFRTGQA